MKGQIITAIATVAVLFLCLKFGYANGFDMAKDGMTLTTVVLTIVGGIFAQGFIKPKE